MIDLELAKQIADYGWVADGVTGDEWLPLAAIRRLAKEDVEVARLMSSQPWVADGLTKHERYGIWYLVRIAEHDPRLAMSVLRQPFMGPPFRHRDALGLQGLSQLTIASPDDVATLVAQPWFEDGVDDREAALLRVLGFNIEAAFRKALIETHFISSVSVRLPLTGEVDLVAIRHTPFPTGDVTLAAMEEGVRAIEGFMDEPFPTDDFVLLVVDPDIWMRRASGSVVGGHEPGFFALHILVKDRRVFAGEDRYEGVIYHELGHLHLFYANGPPRWLSEGSAEFMTAYTRDRLDGESIKQRLAYLESPEGVSREAGCEKTNIREHLDDYRPDNCDYYLGEVFLLAMYTAIGEDGLSAALWDLHRQVVEYGSSPHDGFVYLAFEKHTPPGRKDAFQAAYRRYHGGPIVALSPPVPDQGTALAALYDSAHGSDWENNDNWLGDMPLGLWYGVITAAGEQVTGLALRDNGLSGDISPELGRLVNLLELDLSSNELTGGIPPELGRLTNLKVLNLGDTELTGEIPAALGELVELEDLFLGGSPLTGTIPPELGDLVKLGRLYIVAAELSGEIPAELGKLSSLRGLRLEANQLTGEIPRELGRLTKLWRLELHDNQLGGRIPPELGGLPRLGLLDLSGNLLVGEVPRELGDIPDLTRALDLSRNRLTGEIPSELGRLTVVGRLDLSENQLSGRIPAELGQLAKVSRLDLSRNNLVGEIPAELGRLTELWALDLSHNQLTGAIPAELGGLTNLRELFLSGNRLTGCIPQALRNVPTNDFAELGLPFCR